MNMHSGIRNIVGASALFLSSGLLAGSEVKWSYEGEDGPGNWGELAPEFALCSSGRSQSPIDLKAGLDADLPELVFDYNGSAMNLINNGHTIQQNIIAESYLRIPARDASYKLLQFHFHSPSEHTVKGESYPLEVHFVHASESGDLAVVGVLFVEGGENEELAKLWAFMPQSKGETVQRPAGIEETSLLPPTRDYFYYNGSLTTPPCSEGVAWHVLKQPIEASREQITRFKSRMGDFTNRPVQPHNARIILD